MRRFLNCFPDHFQILEPPIGGGFVADLTPNPLLHIQSRLITRQISQADPSMLPKKEIYFLPSMPSRPVHIQPQRIPPQSSIQLFQTIQKPFPVPLRLPQYPFPPQQGSHPPKNIQPLTMLTRGRNPQPFAPLGPTPTQTRMQRKSRLILKYDRLLRSQRTEFFLRPAEISWHPRPWPADRYNWPVSNDTPPGASNSAPAEPLALSQTVAANEPPRSDHPNATALNQSLTGISLNAVRLSQSFQALNETDAQAGARLSKTRPPSRLPYVSKRSSSDASNLRPRKSIPAADPPVSAREPLSLSRYRLPGFSGQRPIDARGLPPDGLTLSSGFSCWFDIINPIICQLIYYVCISNSKRCRPK
jgi:hypothetical protein